MCGLTQLRLAAGLLLLMGPLTACHSSHTTAQRPPVKVLSSRQVYNALLNVNDIGPRAVQEGSGPVPTTRATGLRLGCLQPSRIVNGALHAVRAVETDIRPARQATTNVTQQVATFRTVAAPVSEFRQLRHTVDTCRTLRFSTQHGNFTLQVAHNTRKADPRVDAQVNVVASGTGHYATAGVTVPFNMYFSAARIANNLVTVTEAGTADATDQQMRSYMARAVHDLRAVMAGKNPNPIVTD